MQDIPQFETNDDSYTTFSVSVMNAIVDALNRNSHINSTGDEFIRVNVSDKEIKVSFNKDALLREIKKALQPVIANNSNESESQSCLCRYA